MVYFSCARDLHLLTLSLESLRSIGFESLGRVFIVVDSKSPFNPNEEARLRRSCPDVEFLALGSIDWASIETLKTEIKAFDIAATHSDPRDFVAKVDSDVLFFSGKKLLEISNSDFDFVGDGHYSRYQYAQGGLYLLRSDLARELAATVTEEDLQATIRLLKTRAEDQTITELVRKRKRTIWLTRIMLFPDEFSKTNLNRSWVQAEFSALHFVHKKEQMEHYAAIGWKE